jgi:predicted nucleotidyltransferase
MNEQKQEKSERLLLKEMAEISLQKGKEIILQNIPSDEIISIYIKGSYVQDELRPESDVDIVVILKSEKYLSDVYKIREDYKNHSQIPFQVGAYTMDELQTGVWAISRVKKMTPISVFVKHLDNLPLLYGSKIESELLHTRTDTKELSINISVFRKLYLPGLESSKYKLQDIVKHVLWLVEREQRALGHKPDYSWQKLADSIEDKNHIVHDALKLRRQPNVSKQEQDDFLKKLSTYLDFLEAK